MKNYYSKCDFKKYYSFKTHVSYKNSDLQNFILKLSEKFNKNKK